MPRGLRHTALSISFLSPIVRRPDAFLAIKIASLIFLPERRFLDVTSFQRRTCPTLSFGSSSLISLRRQALAFSCARFRPPGNIHRRSRLRLTKRTLPRLTATNFEDFAISVWFGSSYIPRLHNSPILKMTLSQSLSWFAVARRLRRPQCVSVCDVPVRRLRRNRSDRVASLCWPRLA
jgi:hypothetical protein